MVTGRKPDAIRSAWMERFNLAYEKLRRPDHYLTDSLLFQLSMCKSDEARRLILGISS